MAYCMNCGAELQKGAAFCIKCGAKADDESFSQTAQPEKIKPKTETKTENVEIKKAATEPAGKKKSPALLIAIIAVIVLAGGGFAAFKIFSKPPIEGGTSFKLLDIYDYVSITTQGYDGAGVMELTVDSEGIKDMLQDEYFDLDDDAAYEIANAVVVTPAQKENLSNGQEVLMTVGGNTVVMSEKGIRFKEFSWNYLVGGLDAVIEINPFDYVDVSFEGISPRVTAKYEVKKLPSEVESLYFELSQESGLAKGDEITLKCTSDAQSYLEYGVKLTELERKYTVENVTSYIKLPEEITDTALTRMKKEAEDNINAILEEAKNDERSVTNTGLTYEGLLVVTRKELCGSEDNEVILVYSTDIASERLNSTKVYYPFKFTDVVEYSDGTIDYGRYVRAFDRDTDLYPFGYVYESAFYGFKDTTTMFSKLARSRTDEYTYEVGEDLKDIF